MLKIKIPNICKHEQIYSIDVLLGDYLGINFEVEVYEGDIIEITKNDIIDNYSKITLDSSFFHKAHKKYFSYESMPILPLKNWVPQNDGIVVNLVSKDIPVLYGSPGLLKNKKHIHLNMDIFGSAFFMLSRYEELITKDRDKYNRFPSSSSISFKANFLNRPLVDEYSEILWSCLSQIWPELERKQSKTETQISCDVDRPYDCSVETLLKTFRGCVGDLIKRKKPIEMLKRLNRYVFNKFGIYKFDRHYTFDFYMNACENAGLKATFYFIPSSKEPNNGCYEIKDKKITNLIKKIVYRGHEIGIHGSFQSYKDKQKIIQQKNLVEKTLNKLGLKNKIRGNRQHYLRWDSSVTPDYLDAAGFEYDTSGSYADHSGFKYGTCKKFNMWGWQEKKKLSLKQQPLIVMENSIAHYMGLGYSDQALKIMKDLKKKCQIVNGAFTLLWHNPRLVNKKQIEIFNEILSC